MATLLSEEWVGGRLEKTWAHTGADGRKQITVETVQDVEPIIENTKMLAQNGRDTVMGRFKGNVPGTMLEEACRINSKLWGVPFRECFREVMQGKTDRAKRIWNTLIEGSDTAKLQARYWR